MTTAELVKKIQFYNEQYRIGKPQITDSEYDSLVERLKQVSPDNDWFKHIEPVIVSTNRKTKLPIPMRSLNKVKNIDELLQWAKYTNLSPEHYVFITPKFDGISLLYDTCTAMAYSRGGDDNEGQDCKAHIKALDPSETNITSFHKEFPEINFLYGELVFSKNKWETYFENKVSENGIKYKSPRNTVAGFINRDTPSPLLQHTTFYQYGVDRPEQYFKTYQELYASLSYHSGHMFLGHKEQIKNINTTLLHQLYEEWQKLYYIDGLVIYVDDISLWNTLGRHEHTGNPIYAIAYKHPDFSITFTTTVKNITWNTSKSGAFKPVVNIEAVNTGDCNMENPTGYNAGWIADRLIGEGAKIEVTRSGGVIPKILKVVAPSTPEVMKKIWNDLAQCPHCGTVTQWDANHVELCCTNPYCKGVLLAKAIFFFKTVGVENIGEEMIAKIFYNGYEDVKSILNITFQELLQIEGFGDGLANTFIQNMNKIKQGVELTTLMHASDCFAGIGKIKAQKILDGLSEIELDDFINLKYVFSGDKNSLSITQRSFVDGIKNFYGFVKHVNIPIDYKETEALGDKYKGAVVCFSGIRDNELEKAITENGGKISGGVTKNTTVLVVKDKSSVSSKITKAKALKIPIVSIEEFKNN